MPRGPRGEYRPADPVQCAHTVMLIAIGEKADTPVNPAQVLGRAGGLARAKKLSPKRRREIARLAAEARWAKQTQ
jgi:hypothetical protein